jgi:DNA repair protein RecN (Recombination protein N)
MLTRLHVRNLVIVTELDLELGDGMTALTGETGAGKSILIDALGLALGDRADTAMIRNGAARAEITATFDTAANPRLTAWLEEQALDQDEACVVRRVLARKGRSLAFINGTPVPIQSLQQAGALLLDIHGQHAHQSLLRPGHQRLLLDGYGGHQVEVSAVAETFGVLAKTRAELERLSAEAGDRASRLDLLRFQVSELEGLALAKGEIAELDEIHARLSNAGRLLETCGRLTGLLYEDESSVESHLGTAIHDLDALLGLDPALGEPRDLLESAAIQVREASNSLRGYMASVDLDPQRLAEVEERIDAIHTLARKYRCEPTLLPDLLAQRRAELAELENADVHLETLERELDRRTLAFNEAAGALSARRARAGEKLSEVVTEAIHGLGMPGGRFEVRLEPIAPEKAGPNGAERVQFLVSANPGQPPQLLAKVASGGELSRISLAIQVAAASCDDIPTLIFDEVDVGIGGAVAEIVGRLLRQLGGERQVLCVTHLPQVAAQAHQHLLIRKHSYGHSTQTRIHPLDANARVQEIARMLGGIAITDSTLAHAREMIEQAGTSADWGSPDERSAHTESGNGPR